MPKRKNHMRKKSYSAILPYQFQNTVFLVLPLHVKASQQHRKSAVEDKTKDNPCLNLKNLSSLHRFFILLNRFKV